ncbi:hypothetical protein HS041_18290 [Planomonospora sp. ID67723]|uniref:hypothetical protein n=1 Tax=Planomonospora sp. ID67723 TaxID=2738134 RepID=UPI0018C3DE82|nr:hypothetical protein [Planomonospora sp. ID67723]MBG0829716.1 hypothetical protein [Planomonospora sp. ID67723]
MSRTLRSNRMPWRLRLTVVAVIVAAAAAGQSIPGTPASADPAQVCRLTFTVQTGNVSGPEDSIEDGLRNDSIETISLGGQKVIFEDSNGDGSPDENDFHSGGTHDTRRATFTWDAHLTPCVPAGRLADGFEFEHTSPGDGLSADNWNLSGLKITDRDTGFVYYHLPARNGQVLHRFRKDEAQKWNTKDSFPDPVLDSGRADVCRLRFTIVTGKDGGPQDDSIEDGLGNGSTETISVGGQKVIFADADGDGVPNESVFHSGGTHDARRAAFTWDARLSPCVPHAKILDGFEFEHYDPFAADNWNLSGLKITDLDTGFVYYDLPSAGGRVLHRFHTQHDQRWNTVHSRPTSDTDGDGDALPDDWELHGFDAGSDARVDVPLPSLGADPRRKDVFVEIDCMVSDLDGDADLGDPQDHSHCPSREAMTDVVKAFADSPVPNADGTSGVQLHLDTGTLYGPALIDVGGSGPGRVSGNLGPMGGGGSPIPEAGNTIVDWRGVGATSFFTLKAFDTARRAKVFRYAMFAHQTNNRVPVNDCTSGWAEGIKSNDFMITLGGRRDLDNDGTGDVSCWGEATPANGLDEDGDARVDEDPVDGVDNDGDCAPGTDTSRDGRMCGIYDLGVDEDGGFSVGDRNQQAGTFMHELGHGLGLDHGGDRDLNNKPNYLSVMNYRFQQCRVPATPPGAAFPLPGNCDYSRIAVDLNEAQLDECVGLGPALGFGPMDWNSNGTPEGATCPPPGNANISADVNSDDKITDLPGFEDWSHLFYAFQTLANFGDDGPITPVPEEADRMAVDPAPAPLPAPRWAFAYVNKATVTEAPIGVPTAVAPGNQWSTGGSGATVTHTGPGAYEVRLPGVASDQGIAHVTPFRTNYRGRTCAVTGYTPSWPDELVKVQCHDETGAPADWWFTITFTAPSVTAHPYATVRYTGPRTDPGTYDSGTYNSGRGVNHVLRDGTGRYRAVIPGAPFARATGHVMLTPYGPTRARCAARPGAAAGDAVEISVSCYSIATGRPVDASWLLSYSDGGGVAAYTRMTPGPAIDPVRSYSVTGDTPSIERLGLGWYRVKWEQVGRPYGNVQVTSTATDGSYCHLGLINDYGAPPQLWVDVYCHTPAGARGDSEFGVTYLRRPA